MVGLVACAAQRPAATVLARRVVAEAPVSHRPRVEVRASEVPFNPYLTADLPPNPFAEPTGVATTALSRRFRGHDEDALLRAMATRPVLRTIERFSSSTLVFHLDLGEGLEVGFKPARVGEGDWWRHEVAGYHLARVLGIRGRVPPAVSRRVPVRALEGFLHGAELETQADGTVEGAAIFWMPVLARTNLQLPASRTEWSRWMDPRVAVPAEHRRRAGQLMALTVLDYLQANFDRWNTANVRADERGDLVFRDNNRAWYPENLERVTRGGLRGIRRVPEWLLRGIERATPAALRESLARDPLPAERLLSTGRLRVYDRRRHALLRQIAETMREHGRARVLFEDGETE